MYCCLLPPLFVDCFFPFLSLGVVDPNLVKKTNPDTGIVSLGAGSCLNTPESGLKNHKNVYKKS